MKKINFKRKKGGEGNNWGTGLDYLLKDYWDDLDKLVEDNYYERHNSKLINFLFLRMLEVLKKAINEMKVLCPGDANKKELMNWLKKLKIIQRFGQSVKSLNEKVIFIDTTTQFLRETSIKKQAPCRSRKISTKRVNYKKEEFKGIVASCSLSKKIQGIVKIILNDKDFSKIKKGNILVTHETNANFLPTMKKAKALIMNMGGVLCHAAIISRELKIPCIIGTKIATQVLRDGDLVEMDAEKGIVRILKRQLNK